MKFLYFYSEHKVNVNFKKTSIKFQKSHQLYMDQCFSAVDLEHIWYSKTVNDIHKIYFWKSNTSSLWSIEKPFKCEKDHMVKVRCQLSSWLKHLLESRGGKWDWKGIYLECIQNVKYHDIFKIVSLELQCRHKWFLYNLINYLAALWWKANKSIFNQTFAKKKIDQTLYFTLQ